MSPELLFDPGRVLPAWWTRLLLPPLSHMTSFYITKICSAENEERPRMRRTASSRRGAELPERHGPVQQREREGGRGTTSPPFPSSISANQHRTRTGATQVTLLRCPEFPLLLFLLLLLKMSVGSDFGNPLRKFKLVFLGEQSGETCFNSLEKFISGRLSSEPVAPASWQSASSSC